MDTKKEVARIMREVADVQDRDHELINKSLAGHGMKIPNHFDASQVTGGDAAREHAENDRRKTAAPIIKKP
jgi:hypothetical protein